MTSLWFAGFLLILGLVVVSFGADALVRGATSIAAALGISPLVIGLTVVSFGTSAPEAAVSVSSVWQGQGSLALGNVVGSNIFNSLMILGLAAVVSPLVVSRQVIRKEAPIMLLVSVLILPILMDSFLSRLEAAGLFMGLLIYTGWAVYSGKKAPAQEVEEVEVPKDKTWQSWSWLIGGAMLLVLGSNWMVDGAVEIARYLGLSELVIGLTIVSVGTSLPELATSISASMKKQPDIAVGNVVGSNLFNLLGVLGVAGLASSSGIEISFDAIAWDVGFVVFSALICLPILLTGMVISRLEGVLFLALYGLFLIRLFFDATGNPRLEQFQFLLLYGIAPGVLVVLAISVGLEKMRGAQG